MYQTVESTVTEGILILLILSLEYLGELYHGF